MALKNHALDEVLLQSAQTEFLENGYEKASLRKIASQAGVTIGAIYTRYPTKDALFCSLVQPLLDRIDQAFVTLHHSYFEELSDQSPEGLVISMQTESETILHLLFDDYDRAVLLLCRSGGSSLETYFESLVDRKIRETLIFFRTHGIPHPDERVLKLLVSGQFHMYFQIISGGCDLTAAKELMHAAILYHTGGWLTLLNTAQETQKNGGLT